VIADRLANAAAAMAGSLLGADVGFSGVSTDSRAVAGGALFFALRGERFDGHAFVVEAARRGAAAAVVERLVADAMLPQVVVADTLAALGALAAWWRKRLPARIVAVAGSNGKTTTRTLVQAVLAQAGTTGGTRGNLNNEVGLPLSVLSLDVAMDYAVLEMGEGRPGDIAEIARIARPQVAVVTNVGPAHLERLGSLEGAARTLAGAYEELAEGGIGVVNADDAFAPFFRGVLGARARIEFGLAKDAAVRAVDLDVGERCRFTLVTPAGSAAVDLPLPGRHNVMNALAAAACAHALGIGPGQVARALAGAHGVAGRLTRHDAPAGWTLVDDSYNANPASTMAGIASLVALGGHAWLALGDMKELGAREAELHAEVGRYAREQGVARLFAVGPLAAHAAAAFGANAQVYPDRESLAADLGAALVPGVRVLVKGSRSSGMDRVAALVLAAHGLAHAGGAHAA
jgi:UDP-N-acetylmuramoyl-tripeptide--D-alanyl-D-alanine ligase